MNTVAYLTTAPMGGYKSYSRGPAFVMDEWLPEHSGVLYTTIPLNVDEIVIEAAKRHKISEDIVRRRIQVIDRETVNAWTKEGSVQGPWEMDAADLAGAHLQFDEFHHYAPKTGEVERRRLWREWIAEIRHDGATIEFLTQDLDSVDKRLVNMVGLRVELVNQETERDPLFKIQMGDWYELKAKAIGYWSPCIWQIEKRKVDRKWVKTGLSKRIYPTPRYYELYNSYAKPHRRQREENESYQDVGKETPGEAPAGAVSPGESYEKVAKPSQKQWERRSWPGLLAWFISRNAWALSSRVVLLLLGVWFFFGGGLVMGIECFVSSMESMTAGAAMVEGAETESKPDLDGAIESGTVEIEKGDAEKLMDLNPVLVRTDFDVEGVREYRAKDMPQVILEREVLYAEIDSLRDEVDRLKNEASRLVMLGENPEGNNYAVFESGASYMVGDTLTETGYYGKTVKEVNRNGGYIVFTDLTRVFVGGLPTQRKRRSVLGAIPALGTDISAGKGQSVDDVTHGDS